MDTIIETVSTLGAGDVEVVERKGTGHPDTICDALAEQSSMALSQYYLDHCDQILHHNVDKVLLRGGVSDPAFGGGKIVQPIEIYIAGRATLDYQGGDLPVEKLVLQTCREWIQKKFHAMDVEQNVVIKSMIRPGSGDLVDLYMRQKRTGKWMANDTSCGVGYAPLSELEKTVLHVEEQLNLTDRNKHPELGQDIKIMGVRKLNDIDLTVAAPMISQFIADMEQYEKAKKQVRQQVQSYIDHSCDSISITVNAADDPEANSIYLTVSGTSAESGDDGEAGRGNRANGLITPNRPMTMESVAGKNPVTHVGKLYNIVARSIAERITTEFAEISQAECVLVSRIGFPIDQPQIVHLRTTNVDNQVMVDKNAIKAIIDDELSLISSLWKQLIRGEIRLY